MKTPGLYYATSISLLITCLTSVNGQTEMQTSEIWNTFSKECITLGPKLSETIVSGIENVYHVYPSEGCSTTWSYSPSSEKGQITTTTPTNDILCLTILQPGTNTSEDPLFVAMACYSDPTLKDRQLFSYPAGGSVTDGPITYIQNSENKCIDESPVDGKYFYFLNVCNGHTSQNFNFALKP